MASDEEQQEHLRRLMEESDAGEVDFVEVREDNSDTEQDISNGEAEDRSLIGKDKATKWMKQVPAKTVRTRKEEKKQTREGRKKIDKLASIREFFDLFLGNCKTGSSPSENVTIDEKLEGFRGKCSFRQYIPSKPNKYGIKIFALSDAKMYYTMNLEAYVRQQLYGPYKVSNSPNCIVERLCEPITGSGRNLTMDNWFTSISLVEKLYKEYTLTVIGIIRKNKKELPLYTQRIHRVQVSLVS
ncbi:hypothetical protein NQ314_011901 [Rhamnusium bicolor]|uniref:PiggyBac transposable element-derived protein domain-containing protein n=1 Tax=Rhamnusium bicolor TaxID=1586634 RepID=A0AAV8XFG1_9CUCU|nr:hypothetical protein NQ314_011901 [Rhamnusium bicolor]